MSNKVISVEHLSKQYHLGTIGTGTFYNDLKVWWAKQRGKPNPLAKIDAKPQGPYNRDIVWALNDINFQVDQGEALGIIGKNGAGKSTLLKILSRVTAPTSGKIKVIGRIASLLEVGTGFHPELTGRENIYLNGAILGMSREEVNRKLDEIIAFSGVEKYIDTPVKRYSSGMYVRLAFAVAAHLEPEILVVDEVLAVGDAEFQKKCLGKMSDVANEGRTVLFVSHNMGAIEQLCTKAMVFDKGQLSFSGKTDEAITRYLEKNQDQDSYISHDIAELGNENKFCKIFTANQNLEHTSEFRHDESIRLIFEAYLPQWDDLLEICVIPCDKLGRRISVIDIPLKKYYNRDQTLKFSITLPPKFLVPGFYSWMIFIHRPHVKLHDYYEGACNFSIEETGSIYSRYVGFEIGCVYPPDYTLELID